MKKARVLLAALLVFLPLAALWVLESERIGHALAGPLVYVIALLFLGAAIAFTVTFTGLDADGNLDRNGVAYGFLAHFWGRQFDQIGVCRMYWSIVLGLMLAIVVVVLCAIIPVFLYVIIFYATLKGFGIILAVIAAAILLFGLITAPVELWKHKKKTCRVTARALVCIYVVISISAILWGVMIYAVKHDISFWVALLKVLTAVGSVLGIIVSVLVASALMVLFIVYVLPRTFASVENTLVGKLFTSTYKKMCPVIPVTPERSGQ